MLIQVLRILVIALGIYLAIGIVMYGVVGMYVLTHYDYQHYSFVGDLKMLVRSIVVLVFLWPIWLWLKLHQRRDRAPVNTSQ